MAPTLGELAQRVGPGLPGLELRGDASVAIRGVCALSPGEPGCLTFLENPKLRDQLAGTRAAAVILTPRDAAGFKGNALVAKDVRLAFARIAALFDPSRQFQPGVHPAAVVAPGVQVPSTTHVGACSVIGADARIGKDCFIGPGCVIGANASIGDGSRLDGRVYVGPRVQVGQRAHFAPGVVIGARGFGLARSAEGWEEMPQLGTVVIGNDVEIGANTTVDRGAMGDTVIEDGVKLDNLIMIAHNCHIGAHTVMAACAGVAGSTRIGARCIIGGCTCINGHIEIGDDVHIVGFTMVTHSLPDKGRYGSGLPVRPARDWRRDVARLHRLGRTEERLRELEQRLGIKRGATDEDDGGEPDA